MNSARELDRQAADWVAARDGDHWTPQRDDALQAWLARSASHRVAFLRAEFAWQQADRLQILRSVTVGASRGWGAGWQRLLPAMSPRRWGATTALACIVALVGAAILQVNTDGDPRHLATRTGEKAVLALDDGSRLTLNTATRVRTEMLPGQRKVWLDDGEAYFEVAPDAHRPFVVYAGTSRVTVLGTKFSVYRTGDSLRVAVVEGHVEVASGNAARQVLAKADAATVSPGVIHVRHATKEEIAADMSWLSGQLQFNGLTLAAAADQFNRYNRTKLLIEDADAASIVIGGTFDATNVQQFARLLESGFGLSVSMEGDRIRVSSQRARS